MPTPASARIIPISLLIHRMTPCARPARYFMFLPSESRRPASALYRRRLACTPRRFRVSHPANRRLKFSVWKENPAVRRARPVNESTVRNQAHDRSEISACRIINDLDVATLESARGFHYGEFNPRPGDVDERSFRLDEVTTVRENFGAVVLLNEAKAPIIPRPDDCSSWHRYVSVGSSGLSAGGVKLPAFKSANCFSCSAISAFLLAVSVS